MTPTEVWTPAALMGVLAFAANQFTSWRKDRREQQKASLELEMTDEERDNKRFREQIDSIIKVLERRVGLAEASEVRCQDEQKALRAEMVSYREDCDERVHSLEEMVNSLSRRLAAATAPPQ
jgi:hypothetical protein